MRNITLTALLFSAALLLFSGCNSSLSQDADTATEWSNSANPDQSADARGSYAWMNNRMNAEQTADELNSERPWDTVGGEGGDDTGDENMGFSTP